MTIRSIAASGLLARAFHPVGVAAQNIAVVVTETAPTVAARVAAPIAQVRPLRLAANTPAALSSNSGLSNRQTLSATKFSVTVAQDTIVDGQVVMPSFRSRA